MGSIIMYTVKEAKEKTVYFYEFQGISTPYEVKIGNRTFSRSRFEPTGLSIEKTSLYDFVMESVDTTTTPKGVGPRQFIEKEEITFYKDTAIDRCGDDVDQNEFPNKNEWEIAVVNKYIKSLKIKLASFKEITISDFQYFEKSEDYLLELYIISTWGVNGNNYKNGKYDYTNVFLTEEEAENECFRRTYEYDFSNDTSRNITYFFSEEEAYNEGVETLAENMGIDEDVLRSILRKQKIVDNLRTQQQLKIAAQQRKAAEIQEKKDLELLADYISLIEPITGEKYKETCSRLSKALGSKISTKAFHQCVKAIRNKRF